MGGDGRRGERKKKYRVEEKERDAALLRNSLAAKGLSIDEIYEMRPPLEPRFHRSARLSGGNNSSLSSRIKEERRKEGTCLRRRVFLSKMDEHLEIIKRKNV